MVSRRTPKSHIKVKDERNVEYFMVSNALIDELSRLSHATFRVYIALCRYANGSVAHVSYKTLCTRLDMSTSTVARALVALEDERLIRVERNRTDIGMDLNTYVLLQIPLTSTIEVTPKADCDDRNHPPAIVEETLLRSSQLLKTESIKDEGEKEVAPLSLARHSPKGERVPPPTNEIKMTMTPERWREISAEARQQIAGKR